MTHAARHIPEQARWRNQRVGLLGGTFNPAHDAHLHISLEAIKRLKLDRVVWLVTPGNPLKSTERQVSMEKRMESAKAMARHPKIEVSDIESRLNTRFTADTLSDLRQVMPTTRFLWLMGADNMVELPKWRDWRAIMSIVPVAIFDRPHYSIKALTGRVANEFSFARIPDSKARDLADRLAPAWTFIRCPRHPLSSTRLREASKVGQ